MKEYFQILDHPISIKEIAYENIKQQIIEGNLKPGVWLREQDLADVMEISRAPIREAFNQLEKEGFIEIIPRKGARVVSLSKKEIEDIFEIRENLELLALRKSWNSISNNRLIQIAEKFKQYKNKSITKSNRRKYLALDKGFHNLWVSQCDNNMLIKILCDIQEKVHWLRGFSLGNYSFNASIEEHLTIINAIELKNEKLVTTNLIKHLRRAKKSIIKEIKSGSMDNLP